MELAQMYCPEMNPRAAFQKVAKWIDRYPGLRVQLLSMGTNPKARTYTPAQVRAITEALGEP